MVFGIALHTRRLQPIAVGILKQKTLVKVALTAANVRATVNLPIRIPGMGSARNRQVSKGVITLLMAGK